MLMGELIKIVLLTGWKQFLRFIGERMRVVMLMGEGIWWLGSWMNYGYYADNEKSDKVCKVCGSV